MPCYHPVEVNIKRKGAFATRFPVTVGCGICLGCRAEQARQWSVRLFHERQMHDSAWFITLTYDEDCLPEHGSLSSKDFQGFFKSLRKLVPEGIRYFGCGEYGERTERPHYHAVLFGPNFLDRVSAPRYSPTPIWRSETLERAWPFGISEIGTVTTQSCNYVAGYVRKKISKRVNPDAYLRVYPETGELVDIEPEFTRMSLRPAIGRTWFRKYWKDVYPRDFVVQDGREFKPPRYYDKLMEMDCKPDEPCFAGGCDTHKNMMMEVREKRWQEAVERTAYDLASKEAHHKKRVNLFASRGKV